MVDHHIAGVETFYYHLDSFSIKDGDNVTPETQIGTMDSTGQNEPCPTHHLHFQVKQNGQTVYFGPLNACHGNQLITYPAALGYSNWNSIPPWRLSVSSDGSDCAGPGTGPTPAGNYFSSASFEGGASGWSITQGANLATYQHTPKATPHEGQWFATINTGSLSAGAASLYQDVPVTTSPGQSYAFAAWLRSDSGAPATVCLALYGLGGNSLEGGASQQTCRTLNNQWQLVTVPLDSHVAHDKLRAQIYMDTAGVNIDVDGTQLVNTGLASASFEGGSAGGWTVTPGANVATYQHTPNATPHEGQYFATINTGSLPAGQASLYQDVPITTSPGQSYAFSAWLRSDSGAAADVCLALYGLGGNSLEGGASQQTCRTLNNQWQLVTVPLDSHVAHDHLRGQIYMDTAGVNIDVDGTQLVNTGLSSASFEGGSSGWSVTQGANLATYQHTPNATPHEGQWFETINTGSLAAGAASLYQDVPITTSPGQSYAFSAWLRSDSGAAADVCLALYGLGGNSLEGGASQQTCRTLNNQWQLVTVPLDSHVAHDHLRTQIYMDTAGVNIDVDGTTLAAGGARG